MVAGVVEKIVVYTFTKQEFAWLQCFMNDLFQDYQVRSGPSGQIVETIRNKFLVTGPVDLVDQERQFLLYNVNDVFQSSHSPVVKPQVSLQVSYVGSEETKGGAETRRIVSQIQQLSGTSGNAQVSQDYLPTWNVMQNIMTKLGQVAPPPYTGETTTNSVDKSAFLNGPQPNVDPDDRIGFVKDGQRTL